MTEGPYERYLAHLQEIHALSGALSLLGWDQETYMPPQGVGQRALVRSQLAGMVHDRIVDEDFGAVVDELAGAELDESRASSVRETKRDRDRAVRVPRELVTELSHVTTLAQTAWAEARDKDEWPLFAPLLTQVVDLKRREAEAVGYEAEPYDALLDEYEPGAVSAAIDLVFQELRRGLVDVLASVPADHDADGILHRNWDLDAQHRLSLAVLRDMGFDFEAGRLDTSAHPFTSGSAPTDVRLTTFFDTHDLAKSLYSTIHEGGHGLYEQGLPAAHMGTPLGEACSLGIHESQSRLWENLVGRSRPFADYLLERLLQYCPEQSHDLTADDLYRALNVVRPSLIRIEADEVTYNLHVLLRFELERALFRGEIEVEALPALWNESMSRDLGVAPATNREGVLQDIHWSFGALGYFPTYTLGNLYSASFFAAARRDLPELDAMIGRGEFAPLLGWLREHIHVHGRRWTAEELCRRATGKGLACEDFLTYLRVKFNAYSAV